MKKIFAIALALVMVLSMASAFAAASMPGTCDWGTWDCTTYTSKCGVAHAKVVKFVRTNDCDPFVESDCAAVVKGERVYFGVQVVFDENVNEQWYNHAGTNLDLTFSKLEYVDGSAFPAAMNDISIKVDGKAAKDVSGKTYWVDFSTGKLVDEFDGAKCVVANAYASSTSAKVCANVDYDFDGMSYLDGEMINFGKYSAYYNATKKQVIIKDNATNDSAAFGIVDGVVKTVETGSKVYNAYYNGKFYGIDWEKAKKATTDAEYYAALVGDGDTCSYLPAMMQFLKLEFGTCVTAEGVQNFFGWKDDEAFKSCATWSKNASSIVDAECVVAIPKTGDASVLAWLF